MQAFFGAPTAGLEQLRRPAAAAWCPLPLAYATAQATLRGFRRGTGLAWTMASTSSEIRSAVLAALNRPSGRYQMYDPLTMPPMASDASCAARLGRMRAHAGPGGALVP